MYDAWATSLLGLHRLAGRYLMNDAYKAMLLKGEVNTNRATASNVYKNLERCTTWTSTAVKEGLEKENPNEKTTATRCKDCEQPLQTSTSDPRCPRSEHRESAQAKRPR